MSDKEMVAIQPKESGHWYLPDGKPFYEVTGKNGKLRPTTLRDAKKVSALPSVTTILGIKNKPGLNIWKLNQVLLSAATLPKIENESIDNWCKRVIVDSQEQAKKAAETGTKIHAALEIYFQTSNVWQGYEKEVHAVSNLLHDLDIAPVIAEKSFSSSLGYGGKIDLIGNSSKGKCVIDFKTKEFADGKKLEWPEMCTQLAAYDQGEKSRLINIFVDVKNPGNVAHHEWTEEEAAHGWKEFKLLLELWKLDKKYYPGE